MRNNAVVILEPGTIVTKDIGIRELKPGHARVAVKAIGICGSDINYFKGGAQTKIPYPLVIGHEISGEITEINGAQDEFKIGDHVVVSPYSPCGNCYPCSQNRSNCCVNIQVYGTHIDGCAMEWCDMPMNCLIKAPRDMAWTKAVLAEPYAIALHGVSRLRLKKGEHVAIIGAGAIGSLSAVAAIPVGAIPIMLDIADAKLKRASDYGVKHTINVKTEDAKSRISDITGGRMAEAVMEISGANQSVIDSLQYVTNAGRVILTGWAKSPLELDTRIITRKELDVLGQRNTDRAEIARALNDIYTDQVNISQLVTKTIRFDEMPAMIQRMASHPDENIKVVATL